jgi:hypothetical protein
MTKPAKLTKKLLTEARRMMADALDARAESNAAKLGHYDRATVEADTAADTLIGQPTADLLTRRGLPRHNRTALATAIGEAYHRNISPLYRSQRGGVDYGPGGNECKTWPYKGTQKRFPAVWHNAGARWATEHNKRPVLVLSDSKNNLVATIQLPRSLRTIGLLGCIHGDAYSTLIKPGVRRRFDRDGKTTGLAVRCDCNGTKYWEHAATVEQCHAEAARKVELDTLRRRAVRETQREQRRLRLLSRISARILVTRDDARSIGACNAGIDAWCARAGITAEQTALPAREVIRLAMSTGERQAVAAALMATRRTLQAISP